MATVGLSVTKTVGRLIFELERGEEKTSRIIDIPNPKSDVENLQTAVDETNARYTSSQDAMNILVQPAAWRDSNQIEQQWTTKRVSYELVTTTTTPVEPDEG